LALLFLATTVPIAAAWWKASLYDDTSLLTMLLLQVSTAVILAAILYQCYKCLVGTAVGRRLYEWAEGHGGESHRDARKARVLVPLVYLMLDLIFPIVYKLGVVASLFLGSLSGLLIYYYIHHAEENNGDNNDDSRMSYHTRLELPSGN
jgi:hypothetical protein